MTSALVDDPLLRNSPLLEGFRVLDPCVLYARLGEGGMGAVFRGRHLNLDIDVAVKVMHASLAQGFAHVVRFEREARLAAQVQHENLIRVFDVLHREDVRYIVMEFVDGQNARQRVRRKGPLDEHEAAAIVLAAARGLGKAHELGVVHRDIKPDNILIAKNGTVKVADLGLAKAIESNEHVTLTQQAMGTPQYMSPDQWQDAGKVGPAADVWALGATLWYLLVGRDPIQGTSIADISRAVLHEPFPDIFAARPDVSPALEAIVARCVAPSPSDRFADARALAAELERVVGLDSTVPADEASAAETMVLLASPPPETLNRIRAGLSTEVERLEEEDDDELTPTSEQRSGGGGRMMAVMSSLATALMLGLVIAYWTGWLEEGVRWVFRTPAPIVAPIVGGPTLRWVEPWFSEESADATTVVRVAGVSAGDFTVHINGVAVQPESDGSFVRRLPLAQYGGHLVAEASDAEGRSSRLERVIPTTLENPWPGTRVTDRGWAWFGGVAYPGQVVDPASGMPFALIPPGQFKMGSTDGVGDAAEHPQFTCEVRTPFYLGRTEVTIGEWRRFVEATHFRTAAEREGDTDTWQKPSDTAKDDSKPVVHVSWDDASAFCAHFGYELPRESHWERAARADTDTRFWWGDDVLGAAENANVLDLTRFALLTDEAEAAQLRDGYIWVAPVASFTANPFGMFDIAGNVREWCRNGPGRYGTLGSFPIDEGQTERVTRGGSFVSDPDLCRSAARAPVASSLRAVDLGFRAMKSL